MKIIKIVLFAIAVLGFNHFALAGPVDINTATAEQLAANIKGIGQKRAEAIVSYRTTHGPFKKVEELSKVKGVGIKLVEKNRENLLISEQ